MVHFRPDVGPLSLVRWPPDLEGSRTRACGVHRAAPRPAPALSRRQRCAVTFAVLATSRSRARPLEIHSKLRRASDFLTTARPRTDPGATFHGRRFLSSALGARTAAHKSRLLPGFCYPTAHVTPMPSLLPPCPLCYPHVQFVTLGVTNANTHGTGTAVG